MIKTVLFTAAIAAYLASVMAPGPVPAWTLSLLCLAIVLATIGSAQSYVRFLGGLFLLIGTFMFLEHGSSVQDIIRGFGKMMNVLSLFALAPLIAIPVDLGKYAYRIRGFVLTKIRSASTFYGITSLMSYMLCCFMNLAALPMVYHMIRPSLQMYPIAMKERFASRAITHGYSMPVIWTPAAPILGIVVDMTGVKWTHLLPIVVPLSLLGVALDWLMGIWIVKKRRNPAQLASAMQASAAAEQTEAGARIEDTRMEGTAARAADAPTSAIEADDGNTGRHPAEIILGILVFTVLISWLEGGFRLGFLLLVTIVVVPFAFVWAAMIGKAREFLRITTRKLPEQLLRMQDQFFVYLSAGFMITAIQVTGYGHSINQGLQAFQSVIGSDLFLLFIPLIPLAFAFVGLHPAVSLALVAESLDPRMLGISVELTAVAMLAGAATAFMMGPYNVTAGMMANLIGRSPYQVSNWNAPFTAAYLILVMAVLFLLKNLS